MTIFVSVFRIHSMDKFAQSFFSMRMMAFAMFIFFLAIGSATMVESVYDTQTAKIFIYNAIWFDLLLVYLGFNLVANIFRYQMFRREKVASLSFHLSFIIILIGAAVTRFASFEGQMQIGEGQAVNFIYSADPYLWYKVDDKKMQYTHDHKMLLSEMDAWNDFSYGVDFPKHKTPISIEYVNYQKDMVDSLVNDASFKETSIELIREGKSEYVSEDGFLFWGDIPVSYEKDNALPGIEIFRENSKLRMKVMVPGGTSLPMSVLRVADRENPDIPDSLYNKIPMDTLVVLEKATLYAIGDVQFVYKDLLKNTKMMKMPSGVRDEGVDILTVKLTDGKESTVVALEGGAGMIPTPSFFNLNGLSYEMTYGPKKIELPFSVRCDDFRLDRYPGSQTASTYESDVTVINKTGKEIHDQTILMNHVMDHGGYRFFQSSYFSDESGTILSVNHDWWGTNITYLGYLFMALGMILTLMAPGGRFRELNRKLKKSNERRTELLAVIAFLITFAPATFSQHDHNDQEGHNHEVIAAPEQEDVKPPARPKLDRKLVVLSKEHSDSLATLLIQDYKGRIIPMHTHCDQFLRKISRSNKYNDLNAVQTIISLHMFPDYWVEEPMLYVSSKGDLRSELELDGSHATFLELTDSHGQFLLLADYQKAHRKMEARRNEYDKQLLKLGDHYQMMLQLLMWEDMKILPIKSDPTKTWYVPLSAEVMALDSVWGKSGFNYFNALAAASSDGNYKDADELLLQLKAHQYKEGGDVAPTHTAVNVEVMYNKMNIFGNSAYSYLTFGFILLVVFFVGIFVRSSEKSKKRFKRISQIIGAILFLTFLYHGTGILMRSYITGYAPWSNGYEAVVFIGWVTMLFGFIFSRKNAVVIAAAAIMAFLMIFVTEMNLMDPEISPMQPVLKSYWLMIHVAIITGSYAPLGMSCILGFLTLILYIVRGKNSSKVMTIEINQLTFISEMVMIIGLFMLTIGTFLGGIWANESWGRYWGWDSKETWALAAVLVYAIILHFRFIPALKDKFTFNMFGFWGYAAILFTFFGVNFYLTGLHSYAQGEAGSIPSWLKWVVISFYVFTEIAWVRNKLYVLRGQMISLKTFRNKFLVFFSITWFIGLWSYFFGLVGFKNMQMYTWGIIGIALVVNLGLYAYAKLQTKNIEKTQ